MTLQTAKDRFDWRRAVMGGVASGAIAVGLMTGFGASTAFAQPAEPTETETAQADARAPGDNCTGDDCSKPIEGEAASATDCPEEECPEGERQSTMTADQALSIIHSEYALGDGGGQLSALIDDVMTMRAQGFKASNANKLAIEDALAQRPNQTPLIEALKATLAYQRKLQAQAQMSIVENGPVAGPVPTIPPATGSINIPLG
jgi:hypothetical protein